MSDKSERNLYVLLFAMLLATAVFGIIADGPAKTFSDFLKLQITGARLIQDFTVTGIGGALLNASLVGLIGLGVVRVSRISLAGPTIAGVFTMLGFGLFGKTPLNCLPIIAGVMLAARFARKDIGSYTLIAMFGTALGPLVTYLMFETPLPPALAIPLGLVLGVAAGALLPAIAGLMLQIHKGYNLYNVGFSCGFLGLFASSVLEAAGIMAPAEIVWNTAGHPLTTALIPAISLILVIAGLLMPRSPVKKIAHEVHRLQKLSGRLPTDFFDSTETGAPLVNMGLLGLATSAFVAIVGAPFNGPVLGGMLTVIGFGAFGKSLRNCWPVVAGVCIAVLVFGKNIADPGPILAALFCTTLAPIAGQFGIGAGMIAGFIHLVMVETTAAWHGGLNLYNNGFAGGLTASLIIGVLHWYRTNRSQEDFKT